MIKIILKIGFRFILSLSLIFVPSYSYSNSVETLINRLEAQYRETQEELPGEFQEASQILREMGTAYTENRLKEYIDSQPELKSKFDVLSLSNQKVEALDYAEKPVFVIHFDNENKNFHSYTRTLTNIIVEFNSEGKLVFKGVVVSEDKENQLERKIGLIHTFDDIEKKDVVDWIYDKELLVILHKRRGLIVYHTMFARTLLGSAPIPSINLPAPNLSNLQNVKLEFIDRAITPPVEAVHNDVTVNLDGKPMFIAGDLLISYNNSSENKKSIARVLSRSRDLVPTLFKMYMNLDALMKIRDFANDNSDQSSISYLERHLAEIMKTVLSATFNRNSISFFSKFNDLISIMPYFLVYKYIDKNPDSFLHTEWFADYQKIRESSPKLFDQRSKEEGKTITSADIAKALQPTVAAKKEEQKNRFKGWFNHFKKEHPVMSEYFAENRFGLLVGAVSGIISIYQSSKLPRIGENINYMSDTVYSIIFLGAGFLLIIGALGLASIPFLKFVKKSVPLPGELKLTIEQVIEKWSRDDIRVADKLTAFGFKVAAVLLPVIYRVFQAFGQSHLFSTLTQGFNPLQKITPDSPLGRAVGINRSMLLGLGLPRWTGENYKKKSQLIDLFGEQKKRVDTLSRVMAYYAISGQAFDIRLMLTGPLTLDSNFDYTDKKLMRNFNWVSQELSKYILKSQKIDMTRPIFEWDITEIHNDFYHKALNLAQEVKSISQTKKQLREWNKTATKKLRESLAWNTEYAKVLMSYYPAKVVANLFWQGLILDHITMATIPLTSFTPRGDYFSGNMDGVAIEPHTLSRSSSPHMHELGTNIAIHDVQSARQQLLVLAQKKAEKLKKLFESFEDLYQPIEEHLNLTKNTPGVWQYLLSLVKYPGANWGQKIYEGKEAQEERIDAGFQLLKSLKIGFRFWAVTMPLGILSREVFAPEYSLISNILGTFYFAGAGFIIYALPQVWAAHHHIIFDKKSTETKKIIDRIKLTAHKIEKRLYASSTTLDSDYRVVLHNFKKLYYSSKKSQKVISLDQINPRIKAFVLQADFEEIQLQEVIQSQTIDTKGEQIQIISSLLKNRHLPTEVNTLGFQIALLFGLGIFSNLAFVYVSDISFRDVPLIKTLGWISALVLGGYGYNFLSSKSISDHAKDIRRGIKAKGASIKRKCSIAFRSLKLKK